ncbi:glycosyltransferase [Kineococcus indalonis]|uniref:glycosyltransferase n=1 Tax=Kineococcus indalonis TaxID=2696566 RepID=UPI00141285AD|nr:glycosyltransferase [Kineococcus indalonis]NAZ88173.1 glycosyltransferase [Kineococcus indalonis]
MADPGPRTALFVLPALQLGGAERHSVLLAQHLDRQRWNCRVVAFRSGPFEEDLRRSGVPVDLVPAPEGAKGVRRTASAVRDLLRRHRPAVVSAQHFQADLPVRLALAEHRARGGGRTPYVVWKHTYGHVGHRGTRERGMESVLGGVVSGYAAVCHTQVTYLREHLGLPTDKVRVVQNSLPAVPPEGGRAALEAALPGAPAGGPVAVVVGALRADKGHRDLLAAWREVVREVPGARLAVVGDGPERAGLEAAAAGVPGVHFLGARVDAPLLASGADVFVLASYNVECFPYAVLEAMAGGIPVVSTATGGLAEMVDHGATGLLVPPRAPRQLASALVEVLGSPGRAAAFGAAGRRRLAEAFPFERWVSEVDELYAQWAGPGGGSA